jgi:hypothetical protein
MLDVKILPQTTIKIRRDCKTAALTIQNNSMESIAFKIKTTKPRDYIVRPNMGMVIPMQQAEVEITLSDLTVPDPTHKFLIEVYSFDWRRSIGEFKQHLKSENPSPAYTSRIGIAYEEGRAAAGTAGKDAKKQSRALDAMICIYFALHVAYLFYRLFN